MTSKQEKSYKTNKVVPTYTTYVLPRPSNTSSPPSKKQGFAEILKGTFRSNRVSPSKQGGGGSRPVRRKKTSVQKRKSAKKSSKPKKKVQPRKKSGSKKIAK